MRREEEHLRCGTKLYRRRKVDRNETAEMQCDGVGFVDHHLC